MEALQANLHPMFSRKRQKSGKGSAKRISSSLTVFNCSGRTEHGESDSDSIDVSLLSVHKIKSSTADKKLVTAMAKTPPPLPRQHLVLCPRNSRRGQRKVHKDLGSDQGSGIK